MLWWYTRSPKGGDIFEFEYIQTFFSGSMWWNLAGTASKTPGNMGWVHIPLCKEIFGMSQKTRALVGKGSARMKEWTRWNGRDPRPYKEWVSPMVTPRRRGRWLMGGRWFGGVRGPLREATFASSNISGYFFQGLCGGTLLVQHQKHLVTRVGCTSPRARRFWRLLGCPQKQVCPLAFDGDAEIFLKN